MRVQANPCPGRSRPRVEAESLSHHSGGSGGALGLAHEASDGFGEGLRLVAHDQRVAVADLDQAGVGQELGQPAELARLVRELVREPVAV